MEMNSTEFKEFVDTTVKMIRLRQIIKDQIDRCFREVKKKDDIFGEASWSMSVQQCGDILNRIISQHKVIDEEIEKLEKLIDRLKEFMVELQKYVDDEEYKNDESVIAMKKENEAGIEKIYSTINGWKENLKSDKINIIRLEMMYQSLHNE